ncbi:hypothetical protein ABK040_004345 [Willaertia magna]
MNNLTTNLENNISDNKDDNEEQYISILKKLLSNNQNDNYNNNFLQKYHKTIHFCSIILLLKFNKKTKKLQLLFLKRKVHKKDKFSGNVCFPGGKLDLNLDYFNLLNCGIREVKEEIGLDLNNEKDFIFLGKLKDHYLPFKYIVNCFVFFCKNLNDNLDCNIYNNYCENNNEDYNKIILNNDEITNYQWININDLFLQLKQKSKVLQQDNFIPIINKIFPTLEFPYIDLNYDFILWGLTLRITIHFIEKITNEKFHFSFYSYLNNFVILYFYLFYLFSFKTIFKDIWNSFCNLKNNNDDLNECYQFILSKL